VEYFEKSLGKSYRDVLYIEVMFLRVSEDKDYKIHFLEDELSYVLYALQSSLSATINPTLHQMKVRGT